MESSIEMSSPHFRLSLSKIVQKLLIFQARVLRNRIKAWKEVTHLLVLSYTTVYICYSIYLTPYYIANSSREGSMFMATIGSFFT